MKKILLLTMILTTLHGFAQDVIIKNDKSEIKSKVTEITETAIKYKKWDNIDGPVYTIAKSQVFMIIYQNGKREVIENNTPGVEQAPPKPTENVTQNTPSNLPTNAAEDDPTEKKESNSMYTIRVATNTAGNAFDLEGEWKFKLGLNKNLLLGFGYNSTILKDALGYYYYGTGGYRVFFGRDQKFPAYLWLSGGVAYTEFYLSGEKYTTPSTFLWEAGVDAPLNKKGTFGLTLYTTQFSTVWLGAQVNF